MPIAIGVAAFAAVFALSVAIDRYLMRHERRRLKQLIARANRHRTEHCFECGAMDTELTDDGFCRGCYDRFDRKSIAEQEELDHAS